jgi:hypothetical protein
MRGRGREEVQISSCFATSLRKGKSFQRICLVPSTSISFSPVAAVNEERATTKEINLSCTG